MSQYLTVKIQCSYTLYVRYFLNVSKRRAGGIVSRIRLEMLIYKATPESLLESGHDIQQLLQQEGPGGGVLADLVPGKTIIGAQIERLVERYRVGATHMAQRGFGSGADQAAANADADENIQFVLEKLLHDYLSTNESNDFVLQVCVVACR